MASQWNDGWDHESDDAQYWSIEKFVTEALKQLCLARSLVAHSESNEVENWLDEEGGLGEVFSCDNRRDFWAVPYTFASQGQNGNHIQKAVASAKKRYEDSFEAEVSDGDDE